MNKRVLLPAVGLLALALVAVLVWALCLRDDDGPTAKQEQARLDACHLYDIRTLDRTAATAGSSVIEAAKDGMRSGDPGEHLEPSVVKGLASGEEAARAAAAVPGLTDADYEVFADYGSAFLGARRAFQEGDAFVLGRQWAPLLEEARDAHERLCD